MPNILAFLSTYPPRECGIASFTADLTKTLNRLQSQFTCRIIAINNNVFDEYFYPGQVIYQVRQNRQKDFENIALELNKNKNVKLICIQHEFGIFGGEYGSYLLTFLRNIQKPVVTTLHTVIASPCSKMREVIKGIANYSQALVVMTKQSKNILIRDYAIAPSKIHIIPHGIHHYPFVLPSAAKKQLGLTKHTVLSTFGLLNPNKGIEYVLDALPQLIKVFPQILYLIIGKTHPGVIKREGERYRKMLAQKVRDLKISNHVRFYNEYVKLERLLLYLRASDLYVAPSLNPNQSVSGTLSYALGAGRPVISTPFIQAKETIRKSIGTLIDFKSAKSLQRALLKLLKNPSHLEQMAYNAYFFTRNMTWENVAITYQNLFTKLLPAGSLKNLLLRPPPIKLTHLQKLTDNFGIIQFAKLNTPDINSGYTLDDNARALIVVAWYYEKFQKNQNRILRMIKIYLNFLNFVFSKKKGFYNYVTKDHNLDTEQNSQFNLEDSNARAIWALATVSAARHIPKIIREKTKKSLIKAIMSKSTFVYSRSAAIFIKALATLLASSNSSLANNLLKKHCDLLLSLYQKHHRKNWEWFEPTLTYSNAVLPEALFLGYAITKNSAYLKVADKTLNFLINQCFKKNMYLPIGQNGWFGLGKKRAYFDQQPEDVSAMVLALQTAYKVTGQKRYLILANRAFSWFLGNNTLHQQVYDRVTGGCYDGVGKKTVNLNQGAESTLAYLLARLSLNTTTPSQIYGDEDTGK